MEVQVNCLLIIILSNLLLYLNQPVKDTLSLVGLAQMELLLSWIILCQKALLEIKHIKLTGKQMIIKFI